ncbi:MAG TPA: hypothetical protein VGY97_01560, partial [Solirubrobacteraceae bacterium]|nr:hypothetical protein [Solirubrobacteraceae bacterium]
MAEVGLPLLAVAAVAILVLPSGKASKVPGSLVYDSRAAPLVKSLRAARQQQLNREHSCRGCVPVAGDTGGCSGLNVDWTCEVRTAAGPRRTALLETYRVTWNRTGCWSAAED